MKHIKKLFISGMILLTIIFCVPRGSFSAEGIPSANDNITTHLPESVSTPEIDIPGGTTKIASEKGGKGWLWAVVIIAAIAGGASLAGGGGGSSGGNSGGGTGSINVSW